MTGDAVAMNGYGVAIIEYVVAMRGYVVAGRGPPWEPGVPQTAEEVVLMAAAAACPLTSPQA